MDLRSLSPKRKGDVKAVLKRLAEGPRAGASQELQDHPGVYRIHAPGNMRVLFTVEWGIRRIRVFRIRPRRTAYVGYERRREH
jgi:mRNA-degrading endonuclease RelE of RelBE toxin-antitoxin system